VKKLNMMTLVAAFMLSAFVQTTPALAGKSDGSGGAGNGGGLWVCHNDNKLKTIRWVRLVDLFEGKTQYGLNIPVGSSALTYESIIKEKLARVLLADRDFHDGIEPHVNDVLKSIASGDALKSAKLLKVVKDAPKVMAPEDDECTNGEIGYVQVANYLDNGALYIRKSIWNHKKFSEQDKAALVFHEGVYKYMRDTYSDENSMRTREIVAAIFSDLCPRRLAMRTSKVLTGVEGMPTSREECGTDERLIRFRGEITDAMRIKDCSTRKDSTKFVKGVVWNLVARKRDATTKQLYAAWKDSESKLVWSDRLDENYNHRDAMSIACTSESARRATAGISGKSFELPKIEQYEDAERHGIRDVLPNMRYSWFWSASLSPNYSGLARGFHGSDGGSFDYLRDYGGYSVRCVGR